MVVNPASDHGKTARRWPEIARAAAARGLDLDVRATEAGGHASELTRAALREGARLIVAVTGVAADRVNRSGKPLGATVAFAWGTVVTFAGYRNSRFRVRIDERELDQVCNNVIVANCRFYASGMKIMPMADPGDGLLD